MLWTVISKFVLDLLGGGLSGCGGGLLPPSSPQGWLDLTIGLDFYRALNGRIAFTCADATVWSWEGGGSLGAGDH